MSINERIKKKKKGFTLIELIIVIAIIAILAAIAIPNFLSIQRKARVNADIATAKNIYDATAALVAEGKFVMPEKQTAEDGSLRNGYGIDLSVDYGDANLIKGYLDKTNLKPQSVKDGTYYVGVLYDRNSDGTVNLDKPKIDVSIIRQDRTTVGYLYPQQTGPFKE